MRRSAKQKLAAAAAVAVVVAGGALAAVNATGQGTRKAPDARPAALAGITPMLSKAGAYLGVPPAKLRDELKSGKTLAQIADASGGRSQAGLIEALVTAKQARLSSLAASLRRRVTAEVHTAFGPGLRPSGPLAIARAYLGLSPAALRSDLRSGMTLAQIADATAGKSQAGLTEALVTVRKERLAAAAAAGTLTSASEHARLARVSKRVRGFVERTLNKKRRSG